MKKVILKTERLVLREFVPEDFEALYAILSDAETMRHYPKPFDEAKVRGWIEWNLENYRKYGFGLWAMELKETGEFLGDCGITMQTIDGEQLPEIGYHVKKTYWRRGLGKEAARAVRDWFFANMKYDAVYSYMKYTNEASAATARANDMTKIAEWNNPNDKVSYTYRITRGEWEALRT